MIPIRFPPSSIFRSCFKLAAFQPSASSGRFPGVVKRLLFLILLASASLPAQIALQSTNANKFKGKPLIGTPVDGETWCLDSANNRYIPCSTGAGASGVTDAQLQANARLYCPDSGANDTYSCTTSPAITALTTGMAVYLKVNTTNTGAATVDIDNGGALAAKAIKLADGTTDPSDGLFVAGNTYQLLYDGSVFRTAAHADTDSENATSFDGIPLSGTPTEGQTWCLAAGGTEYEPCTGGAGLTFQQEGVTEGSPRATLDALDGYGITRIFNDTGSKMTDQIAVNDAVILSRTQAQSGADHVVAVTSSGTDTYTGTLSPALAAYPTTSGMRIVFTPDTTASGASSLNLHSLGALGIYESDGTTNATLTEDQTYELVFEATGTDRWKKFAGTSAGSTSTTDAFASLPTCDASADGAVYHFTNSPYLDTATCDGSSWTYLYRGMQAYPATLADFTAFGTGGSATQANGYIRMVGATGAGNSMVGYQKAVPGASYSIIATFETLSVNHALLNCGVGWKVTADGKTMMAYQAFVSYTGTSGISVQSLYAGADWAVVSASNATAIGTNPRLVGPVTVKLDDNSTNRQISFSLDRGVNWTLWHSETSGAAGNFSGGAPTQVFFGCNTRTSANVAPMMALISWEQGATTQ
jgi:hypothetical protein